MAAPEVPADTRPTHRLSAAGVSIWLDDLSRARLTDPPTEHSLATLVAERDVVGVTTNPSIFAAALSEEAPGKGNAYAQALAELRAAAVDVEAAVERITTDDVRQAADVLRPVFDATHAVDGRVSIEVDPRLARDTEATTRTAARLWQTVDRPNVMIKIPATVEGLPAITATLAQGISVNVTLIFALERYRAVMDAWLAGLEQAAANGHDLSVIGSVASFFVSRVDVAVDPLLDQVGTEEALALRGKAAVANARLAYAAYQEVTGSPRWAALRAAGAQPQRPLWASTGVKNPAYRDTLYVDELVVAGVVNTMPQATLDAFADHGIVLGDTVTGTADDAATTLATVDAHLATAGTSFADVTTRLEAEGVEKFEVSWSHLLDTTRAGLTAPAAPEGAE
jgi:transaldolase